MSYSGEMGPTGALKPDLHEWGRHEKYPEHAGRKRLII